ncbi:S-layer homology domain-containing protein [Alkalihalobacillus oceani]|uniref:S-layer homology domain-containing protein n=1 Tax=Halalkalibacter oceani TaxID=1653776 RepID=A0A9X2DLX8_9BACI|nr:YcdB/YcdC domain-containing protein [Halalkalibacter oceani]MCM3712555.1 S-layer homology domain-containing protein [Halalkalibacter oceani]
MRSSKRLGILSLAAVVGLGTFAPVAGASALPVQEGAQPVEIKISSAENIVEKQQLIDKLKELFPGTFDFLSADDFQMGSGFRYGGEDEDVVRYALDFDKEMGNGKYVYGNALFVGEDLHIEQFNYQPADLSDALFPGKITKEEAEEIALELLGRYPDGSSYQLSDDQLFYYGNQTLTEPIRYHFTFNRLHNGVPVADQSLQVTVLANGVVTDFYKIENGSEDHSYDAADAVIDEENVVEKIKENIHLQLHYQIRYDEPNSKKVELVYSPFPLVTGVHALSGDWKTAAAFSEEVPTLGEFTMLTDEPLESAGNEITLEAARRFAEELLAIDSDEVKLRIESVERRDNSYSGREVISVNYMYEYRNGGYGTNLELDAQTGEIVNYYNIKRDVLNEIGQEPNLGRTLSEEEALTKAVDYLEEYAPSYLHHYAYPVKENGYSYNNEFNFVFPRIENGLEVVGNQLFVTVSPDGELINLAAEFEEIDQWPNAAEAISEEEAIERFNEALQVSLSYVRDYREDQDQHYHLLYVPAFSDKGYAYLDALTGQWATGEDRVLPEVSHPWAEEELNHLLQAGILTVDDPENFNADEKITKGKALEVTMKSLTYIYPPFPGENDRAQSFDNIGPDHPLFQVVEQAVNYGVLDTDEREFALDEPLTREELAVWYIKALGLEAAGKHDEIYQLGFADTNLVTEEYRGYVALANALDLLTASQNQFRPKEETTYAQLAVSSFRLAREAAEQNQRFY